jgi:hypothetical protein
MLYDNAGVAGEALIRYGGSGSFLLGDVDAASPVAQTLGVQSVVAGTTNTSGQNFTIKGSASTGTGAGGSILLQTTPAGSSGTGQNGYTTVVTIDSTLTSTFAGPIVDTGGVTLDNAHTFRWLNGTFFFGAATTGAITGAFRISGSGTNTTLNFGGDTSSFPSFVQSGATLLAKLADNSNYTTLTTSGYIGAGSKPTLAASGGTCAVAGTQTGGNTVGTMTLSGACASTNTVTLGASGTTLPTAPNGWTCTFNDQTTAADANNLHTTSSTTTSVTATWTGAGASSDVVSYMCMGY